MTPQEKERDKRDTRIITGILAIAAIGISIYLLKKAQVKRKMRNVISDAGYETAHDIYFPLKINRPKKKRMQS